MSPTSARKLHRTLLGATSWLLVASCAESGRQEAVDPIEAELATMDVYELAAQTMAAVVRRDDNGTIDASLLAEIATGAAGAVLIEEPDAAAARAAVTSLRATAPHPLLVILDLDAPPAPGSAATSTPGDSVGWEEPSAGAAATAGSADTGATRAAMGTPTVAAGSVLPPARLLAALGEPALLRRAGEEAAIRAREVDAQLGLLSLPPFNGASPLPVTARDPARVAAGLAAFADGAAAAGLPLGLRTLWTPEPAAATLRWDRARLEAVELTELRALLAEDVVGVALGAVRLPALTGDTLPLVLSPAGPNGLLRRDLAFEGVVMADLSSGATATGAPAQVDAAVMALAAGSDLLLGIDRPAPVVDGVAAAVAAGRLSAERLRDAARRVLRLRQRLAEADSARVGEGDTRPARRPDLTLDTVAAVRTALRIAAAETAAEADSLALAFSSRHADSAVVRGLWPPAPMLEEAAPTAAGMRAALGQRIDAIMREGLEDSVFSGAAVAIGRRGRLVLLRGYGREGRGGSGGRVDAHQTIFDLASLTKVVGTTTAAALLVEEGLLELDAPLERYLARFDGKWKEDVRIRHLLTHTSGLPSGLWLFGSAGSSEEALRQVLRQDLLREPGERMEYSDLGMILLAAAAEEAAGMPLDRYLALRLFAPLGMASTMYLPPAALRERIVPTAEDTEREFALHGVVHDANSFRLGGVAGHAGLFSTAADVAVFAQMMLNGGSYGTVRVLSPGVVRAFTTRQRGSEQRALGWDTPSRVSSAGDYFSARSFGHTGYTGTSLWMDPERELFVVLLTNRTYLKASGGDILRLRGAVHDAAARAITDRTIRRRPGSR